MSNIKVHTLMETAGLEAVRSRRRHEGVRVVSRRRSRERSNGTSEAVVVAGRRTRRRVAGALGARVPVNDMRSRRPYRLGKSRLSHLKQTNKKTSTQENKQTRKQQTNKKTSKQANE